MAAQQEMVVTITENKISINGISTYWGIEEGNELLDGFQVFESVYTIELSRA